LKKIKEDIYSKIKNKQYVNDEWIPKVKVQRRCGDFQKVGGRR
jgi:hypothetical protein